jgi:hypothetical protein
MRASVVTDSAGALILAGAIVGYFSPVPGSFWGNTFFGIPYSIALFAMPLAAAACAAAACWLIRRRPTLANRGAVVRGVLIGAIAFLLFAILHGVASAIVALFNGEGVRLAVVAMATIPPATALFGGIFIMPICCIVAVACEWLAGKIAA